MFRSLDITFPGSLTEGGSKKDRRVPQQQHATAPDMDLLQGIPDADEAFDTTIASTHNVRSTRKRSDRKNPASDSQKELISFVRLEAESMNTLSSNNEKD